MAKKGSGPMTPAERQRAYRDRQKKSKGVVVPLRAGGAGEPPEPPDDPPEDDASEVSVAALNARMRRMALTALTDVGGVEYLKRVAAKNANTFLRFVAQFATRDETLDPGAFQIVVHKIALETVAPVAGVIASPVAQHIDPRPRLLNGHAGEVIDAEPRHDH